MFNTNFAPILSGSIASRVLPSSKCGKTNDAGCDSISGISIVTKKEKEKRKKKHKKNVSTDVKNIFYLDKIKKRTHKKFYIWKVIIKVRVSYY